MQPPAPNPYAPPQAPYGAYPVGPPGYEAPPPQVDGDRVTIPKIYAFPPLCVKCGATGELRGRSQRFAWFPAWTYFLLLAGLLPLVIVQMIMTKRAHLLLPLCAPCSSKWTTARVLRSLAIIGPVLVGLGLMFVGVANDWGAVIAIGFLVFFPGILVVIPIDLLLVRRRTLRAVFIDDRVVTLKGVAPPVLAVMQPPR
ncbi:MAG: hypothetical protein ABSE49_15380 [Polyangiaceae bacterium]|jgi:hypothetical protein